MSSLKLNVKNFSGNMNFPYLITYEIEGDESEGETVIVKLHLDIMVNGNKTYLDSALALKSENETMESAVHEALRRAEEKWGIELTKANLKVAN